VQKIDIDIRPRSANFRQNGRGILPVAIFGNSDFDVSDILVDTLQLQGLTVKMVCKKNKYLATYRDINHDGFIDLKIKFEDSDGWLDPDSDFASLTGFLNDDTPIEGRDLIRIVHKKRNK